MKTRLFFALFALCLFGTSFVQAAPIPREAIAKRAIELEQYLSDKPVCIGAPCSDRSEWDALAATPKGKALMKWAKRELNAKVEVPSEELYREFYRSGNRSLYQNALGKFTSPIFKLVVAECLENKGTYIAEIEKRLRLMCAMPSWVLPAHDRNAEIYDGKAIYSDLVSTNYGCVCAYTINLLGDKLSSEVRDLVKENVFSRVITPYREMITGTQKKGAKMWWSVGASNWNAVCTCGTLGAALSLCESKKDRALYLAAAEILTRDFFFKGFTPDGYCSEGMSSWNYGFGHFEIMAALVLQATNDQVDFLQMPMVKSCLMFAPNMEIGDGYFAAFADCGITARPGPIFVGYVSRRLDLGLTQYEKAAANVYDVGMGLFEFLPFYFDSKISADRQARRKEIADHPESVSSKSKTAKTNEKDETAVFPLQTEFPDAGVLICRPFPDYSQPVLAVAMKGGHNRELHNHNDVGTFTMLRLDPSDKKKSGPYVLDPGGEIYTARTFGKDRYTGDLLNSFGHPVPRINDRLQKTGAAARGVVLEKKLTDSMDQMKLDLTSAYSDDKDVAAVRRTFTYYRAGTQKQIGTAPQLPKELASDNATDFFAGMFQIEDEIEFAQDKLGKFETALISYKPITVEALDSKRLLARIGENGEVLAFVTAQDANGNALAITGEVVVVGETDKSVRYKPNRIGLCIDGQINKGTIRVQLVPQINKDSKP